MSHTLSLEDYLAEEFLLLGVKPHITHLQQPEDCYYCTVTVAAPFFIEYPVLVRNLTAIFASAEVRHLTGSDLDRFVVKRFSKNLGCGVAPCHQVDQFNRRIGRVMSEGRLLKLQRRLRS